MIINVSVLETYRPDTDLLHNMYIIFNTHNIYVTTITYQLSNISIF